MDEETKKLNRRWLLSVPAGLRKGLVVIDRSQPYEGKPPVGIWMEPLPLEVLTSDGKSLPPLPVVAPAEPVAECMGPIHIMDEKAANRLLNWEGIYVRFTNPFVDSAVPQGQPGYYGVFADVYPDSSSWSRFGKCYTFWVRLVPAGAGEWRAVDARFAGELILN